MAAVAIKTEFVCQDGLSIENGLKMAVGLSNIMAPYSGGKNTTYNGLVRTVSSCTLMWRHMVRFLVPAEKCQNESIARSKIKLKSLLAQQDGNL